MLNRYSCHYACFKCRKQFKGKSAHENVAFFCGDKKKCPQCGDEMKDMGQDFKAPRLEAKKKWRILELSGRSFHSCGD